MKKLVRLGLVLFIFSIIITGVSGEAKKKKVKLSKTKLSVELGKSKKLRLKNAKGKVKWSSSDKETVVVRKGKVTGKRLGTAVVTAKAGKKKYNCRVSVTIAKEDEVKESEMTFANDIFTKEMLSNVKEVRRNPYRIVIKDRQVIRSVFNEFSSLTLTQVPEPKERLCGYSEYIFIMKDGSEVSMILSGGLKYEGKRYAVDSELGLRLNEFFHKYGVLIKK